ncbi:uncharacterized protein Ecym_7097 [Eremothecium cymbalariae DBVPG|uniref:Uncharacterized protein n=1 Tax=Eremothecium cymbalariae (strain CBS 270.75 / DBVPG 7215 / KCTC 17166 / NRRL Y-17582) TaxID=931890 RepID=G8JVT4_ERECY|nr:hypothetical protein Ecym_7097 [Eremothecium cymbalariae DBVPG\
MSTVSQTATETTLESKCSGAACQKPSEASIKSIVLGVLIPLAVIMLGLGVVLYKVWKKNKQEEFEDNDPNFDGDAEYVPDFMNQAHYPTSYDAYPSKEDTTGYYPDQTQGKVDNRFEPAYVKN